MAYAAMSIPASPAAASVMIDMTIEQTGLRRSPSGKDLCRPPAIRRSYSENHICYSINRAVQATSVQPKLKSSRSMGIFPFQISGSIIPNSLRSFLFDPETSKDMNMEEKAAQSGEVEEVERTNWVERLMEINRQWRNRPPKESMHVNDICEKDNYEECDCDEEDGVCEAKYGEDDDDDEEEKAEGEGEENGREVTYDRESFSKFLVRVPLADIKLFSQLAFLCNMAYVIPQIKATDLRKYYGLQFITSSLEKKAEIEKIKAKIDQDSTRVPTTASTASDGILDEDMNAEQKRQIQPSVAYEIAASAASYVQSQAKDLLSLGSKSEQQSDTDDFHELGELPGNGGEGSPRVYKSEVAAYVAASTMTAVVAAGEKEKQEAAKNLQSLHNSPCEWFVCDEASTCTRCFVIQGSDSLASWQANLFFEPTKFEGTDVIVHRGIYEAAKGIYEQFMPEIMDHLKRYGDRAKLQFTGHSLGGSLSLLVHLMLITRKVVEPSTIRPVVTFGSPFVFCGGQKILNALGLDESHIHCVMMHRDIVPRAFSCNYPNHVAVVLKRLNGTFRSHPCLNKNKLLYSPLGKIFILQPDEKTSPAHHLLPPKSALYSLDNTKRGYSSSVLRAFLNSPHPLETLSDPTAYGSEGTILRDHDSSNYLKAVNGLLRQRSKLLVRRIRKQRLDQLWPLLTSPSPHSWSHERNLESGSLIKREIMTGV